MKTEKEWTTRAGLKAVVIAHDMGHRCGYVGVTKDHPWHGKDCNEANLDVHGGVTYAGARDGLWWFGYDCAHLGDAADPDLMSDEYKNVLWSRVLTIGGETIKTLDFCVNECESMATQLGGGEMSIPHIDDTRESYVERMKANYLDIAERQYAAVGDTLTMWQHLFTWVQCEEIYGGHWDDLNAKGKI